MRQQQLGTIMSPSVLMDAWNALTAKAQAWDTAYANRYQQSEYGTIPAPGAGLPPKPPPSSIPSAQLTTWTPADASTAYLSDWQASKQAETNAIQAAIDAGTYTPNGSPSPLSSINWWIVGGIAAAVIFVAYKGSR